MEKCFLRGFEGFVSPFSHVSSPQVSGNHLRIPQVTAADSGEYVCRVTSGGVTHETSLIVTIQTGAGSSYGTGDGWEVTWGHDGDAVAAPTDPAATPSRWRHTTSEDRDLVCRHHRGTDPGPQLHGGRTRSPPRHLVPARGGSAPQQPGGTLRRWHHPTGHSPLSHTDVSPTHHLSRWLAPACASSRWRWPIRGSMCAG